MDTPLAMTAPSVLFWDGYARWQKQWVEHTAYHVPVLGLLNEMVRPGWRVLDIGAGDGILSVPLSLMGCEVVAVEPSVGMRSLLFERAFAKDLDDIDVDERRWEDIPLFELSGFDLIVACNSLHLPELGFDASLEKAFDAGPFHVLLITEYVPHGMVRFAYRTHVLRFARSYEVDSSFAYHHVIEAFEHRRFTKGRTLALGEEVDIARRLTFREDHVWIDSQARVGAYWFERRWHRPVME